MNPILGYWAAIFAVLTAYVGISGQAVGGQREFNGWMSKPWRTVALHVGAWTTLACWWWNDQSIRLQSLTIFDWTCIVVIAGCVQTIGTRLNRIMAAVERRTK
jgi:hypothetical protein